MQAICWFANQLLTGLRIAKEHHTIDFSESAKYFIYFMILLLLKFKLYVSWIVRSMYKPGISKSHVYPCKAITSRMCWNELTIKQRETIYDIYLQTHWLFFF